MDLNTQQKQNILIRYLKQYLSKKDLKMKPVLRNMIQRIESNQSISMKQYDSIIKFIEREEEFKGQGRDQIFRFFEPLIETNQRKVIQHGNTLHEHFVWL